MPGKKYLLLLGLLSLGVLMIPTPSQTQSNPVPPLGKVRKNGLLLDIRSPGRTKADQMALSGIRVRATQTGVNPELRVASQTQIRSGNSSGNIQVNDGSLDNIQSFPQFIPHINFNQSETSIAVHGNNIVAAYNTDAFTSFVLTEGKVEVDHSFASGFSNSADGGQTWTTSFMPPLPESRITLGDPVVEVDRQGNFHFVGLGEDKFERFTIQSNRSTDGGRTWSDAVVVQQDTNGDKPWLAVGPDPANHNRDNLYVTWTSFQPDRPPLATSSELRFGRSTDGGVTWRTKTIFTPSTEPQATPHFSNPYVDPITGRLYVPFVHLTSGDVDFIQMLVSDDAGDNFSLARFNIPGAPDSTLLPFVLPGTLCDCGASGIRLVISSSPDIGGRFGVGTFVNATRIFSQPAIAASNGFVYLAYSASASPVSGDPSGHSNVLLIRSDDGGVTWTAPIQVNRDVATDIHHVQVSLAIGADPNSLHIGYYTQHTDGTVDVDLASSLDMGNSFPANRRVRITSSPFNLAPTNIPRSADVPYNYNLSDPCYGLGEYMSVKSPKDVNANPLKEMIYVLWTDGRNTVTHPPNLFDPLTGVKHPQQDVFFQAVRVR
jgi:hypothetical protein